jgi:uncharacterized protein YerC
LTDFSSGDEDPALQDYALIAPCIEDGMSHKARAAETGVSRKTISRKIEKFHTGRVELFEEKQERTKAEPVFQRTLSNSSKASCYLIRS